MTVPRRRAVMKGPVLALLVCSALAGCGGVSEQALGATEPVRPTTTTTSGTTVTPPTPDCDPTASYRPAEQKPAPGAMPPGTTMRAIQDKKQLTVGVDETTQGLAYRDPDDGEIKGMEVDLANEIALRIFGDVPLEDFVKLVPLTTDEKVAAVKDAAVDLTIDAVSMSCGRWQDVDFSTEYLTTDQKFLVPKDSPIRTAEDLVGRTVCVTGGSSSAGILKLNAPDVKRLEVGPRTECLVALQQGTADAYFGHETFLRGLLQQDGTLEIRKDVLPAGVDVASHYGIAIAKGREDLVRFVNRALEDMRADGTLARLHDKLERELGLEHRDLPAANHERPEGS
jgi:polar amino acid transport system substrate-binding protein